MVRHVLNLTFGPAAGNVCHTAAAPTIDPNSFVHTRAHTCMRVENKATNQYLTPGIFLEEHLEVVKDPRDPRNLTFALLPYFVKSSFAAIRGA